MNHKTYKIGLTTVFVLLYGAVGFVSCYHAFDFFSIANTFSLAVILAAAFELGQAAVLFVLITDNRQSKRIMPWLLLGTLTAIQIIGNVVASYEYMITHSQGKIDNFVNSIMFFVKDPDPNVNIVIVSYIVGAILPIIALCMTSLVVGISSKKDELVNKVIVNSNNNSPNTSQNEPKVYL